MVSVDGEEAGSICIQVPEKELELENQHYLDSVANCESSFG